MKKVISIARQTRADLTNNFQLLRRLGLKFSEDTLCGLCAFASKLLCQRLQRAGIQAKIVCGYEDWNHPKYVSHVWVEVDGKVIDITAQQYSSNLPDVYIGYIPVNGMLRSPRKTLRHWGKHENPYQKRVSKFERAITRQQQGSVR